MNSIEKRDNDRGVALFTLTNRLLKSYIGRRDSRVNYAKRRAALDAWPGMIGDVMTLEAKRVKKLYMPMTGGRYLST